MTFSREQRHLSGNTLGGLNVSREDRGIRMRDLLGNVRYTLRQFRAARAFVAAAVLTLALGIGGTTAIFALVDAVMLRSLPVGDPGRLYRVGEG